MKKLLSFLTILSIISSFFWVNDTNAASCPTGYNYYTPWTPGAGGYIYMKETRGAVYAWTCTDLTLYHFTSSSNPGEVLSYMWQTAGCYKLVDIGYHTDMNRVLWYTSNGGRWLQDRNYFAGSYWPFYEYQKFVNTTPTIASITAPDHINLFTQDSTSFTINGITDPDSGQTLTYMYSWDNTNWNVVGTWSTPQNNLNFAFSINTSSRPEGNNILYVKVNDGSVDSSVISSVNIVKDTISPTLTEITPVSSYTNDTTPEYIFNTTEPGSITYSWSCSSSPAAWPGNNTLYFNSMMEGSYNNCYITVTDTAGNTSSSLHISGFTIDTTPPAIPTSVVINSGDLFTNNTTVSLNITHPNDSDVYERCVSTTNSWNMCTWTTTKPTIGVLN